MTPQQAIDALHALPRGGHGTLDRMRALMNALGNPEKDLKCVQIAGTNGKGTLAVMTASILQKAGYKTGLTISPYVTDFRERFQINGEMIPPQTLADLTERVLDAIDAIVIDGGDSPREFEAVTAVALLWFAQSACDIVVLETGMGGLYDATNIVPRTLVAAITRIGMDHMEFLGDTLADIAAEKAGIIKEGCTVVCYPDQPQEAMGPILTAAANAHAAIVTPETDDLIHRKCRPLENYIDYGGYQVMLKMPGRHPGRHAAPAAYSAICRASCSPAPARSRIRPTRESKFSTPSAKRRASPGRKRKQSIPAVSTVSTPPPSSRSAPIPSPRAARSPGRASQAVPA